jgi:prolyl-tRNA synthetase
VRAGYVRRTAPGIYSWLPLGKKVLLQRRADRPRGDGRDRRPGAAVPRAAAPRALRGDRPLDRVRPELFRLKDRKGADYLLGPTHEEMFTLIVKDEYSSYKDLPVIALPDPDKYRDEARPRAGILRGREFVMKDSYSFDLDDEGLERSYQLHREAYIGSSTASASTT